MIYSFKLIHIIYRKLFTEAIHCDEEKLDCNLHLIETQLVAGLQRLKLPTHRKPVAN